MRRVYSVIFPILFLLAAPAVIAQGSLKIGHVNAAEVLEMLPVTDSVNTVLQNEADELQIELQNMQTDYNNTLKAFQDNSASWSQLVRDTKQSEIIDKQSRIQRFNQSANDQLQRRNAELFQPIYDRIQKAIDEVSVEGKFTYILDIGSGAVLFTTESSQNIQPLVLKKLGVNQ